LDPLRCPAGVLRFSTAYFLVALALMFVARPFIEPLSVGRLIEAVLFTLVLLSGVLAAGRRRATLIWAMALAAPALVGQWVQYRWPSLVSSELSFGTGVPFTAFITLQLLRFIVRAPQVDSDVLCAAVATYLLLGLLWSLLYSLAGRLIPDAFAFSAGPPSSRSMEGFTALYFSLITLATVGYGDIVPVAGVVRMLAAMEAIVGMFYVALLIARLVSLYPSKGQSGAAPHER
jgi:voltage-gated potassium channel